MGWGARQPIKVKAVLNIGINEKGQTVMGGLLEDKELCYRILADALKLIVDYKPGSILLPDGTRAALQKEEEKVEP
jgi:hypothetical protein